MAQVTGRVYVSMAGQRIRSKEGAKLELGGVEREAALSDSGVDGYTEKTVAPKVECKISHTADTSLSDLAAFSSGTVSFQTDTGRMYTIKDGWLAKPPTLEKGEVSLEFSGMECIEG